MKRYMGPLILTLPIAIIPLFVQSHYYLSIFIIIGLHTIIAVGLSLLMGYAGQVSLGHAAFYGMGAYTSAILSTTYGINPWLALLAAALLTGAVGYLIAWPTLRLRGHFLAMATLGWGVIVFFIFNELGELTGGPSGLTGIPYLTIFGIPLNTDTRYYYLVWAMTIILIILSLNIVNSRVGRALRAIHGSEVAADSLGVDTAHLKVQIFTLSAVYASIAGSLYTHYLVFVNPDPFRFMFSIELVVMVILGGLAHLWGALFGAAILTFLREFIRGVLPKLMGHAAGEYEIILFGIIVVLVMIFMPEGVWPRISSLFRRVGAGIYGIILPRAEEVASWGPGMEVEAPSGSILGVKGLTKTFNGLLAVNQVDFDVERGQIFAIIGPNGAGKTTIFNLVSAVLPPTSGEVQFEGRRVHRLKPHDMAHLGLTRTFQNVRLFGNMTVLENVMVGLHRRTRSGILRAALRTPLARREEREVYQEAMRYLTLVGLEGKGLELASSLPIGQQRLLELARALASQPKLLLLDEPGAGLSFHERQRLGDFIKRIRDAGVTILLIGHEMDLVMTTADWVAALNYGEKIAEGPPEVIQNDEKVLAAYLGEETVARPQAVKRDKVTKALLEVRDLRVAYGRAEVLKGVSVQVGEGEIVAIIGSNGAGKTTLLNSISGLIPPKMGQVTFDGRPLTGLPPEELVRIGISYVPERRQLFPPMTVSDNLILGACHRYGRDSREEIAEDMEEVFSIFPILKERRNQLAGTLSGGELQMLVVAMGLMAKPKLLLLDEPSLGLAPLVVREIMRVISQLRDRGMTILLVEQNARAALAIADRGYVIETGNIVLEGDAETLKNDRRVQLAYLGKGYKEETS